MRELTDKDAALVGEVVAALKPVVAQPSDRVRIAKVASRNRKIARATRRIANSPECEFRRNPAGDSDLKSATVPI